VSAKAKLAKPLNDALRPLRVQLVSGISPDPAIRDFLPARKTIAAADKAGLSVSAYIDRTFAEPGTTPDTVKAMLEFADLHDTCKTVCEIGPGTGRYAQEVIAALHPDSYEIYETAKDWLPHLRKLPNAVIRDCDGRTLSQTPSASVDLVHAQKTLVYLEFYVTAGYLDEMARVVRPGGAVAVRDQRVPLPGGAHRVRSGADPAAGRTAQTVDGADRVVRPDGITGGVTAPGTPPLR